MTKNTQKNVEEFKDGCLNFSIYSKESIKIAKNTNINLNLPEDKMDDNNDTTKEINRVVKVSSSSANKLPEQQ